MAIFRRELPDIWILADVSPQHMPFVSASRQGDRLEVSEQEPEALAVTRIETIGDCTLYLGDCMEILPTLGRVDCVVTDPPYGIKFAAQPTSGARKAGRGPEKWDDAPIDGLESMLGVADKKVVWGGNYYVLPPSRGWLVWYKPDAPPSMSSVELAWTNIDQNSRQISWSIAATNAERVGHPTQKPLAVMMWTIKQIGSPQSVIDPFMGSGTTGVACVKLGRKFIGIETDERYFDIACRRIDAAERQPDMFVAKPDKTAQLPML